MRQMNSSKLAGTWYLTAVGLALCLIAALFLWLMGRSYLRAREMASWPKVPCLILRSEVSQRRIAENVSPDYRFAVLYRYESEGRDYESTRSSLRGSMPRSEVESIEALVQQFTLGSTQSCWVNPRDPAVALLKLDSRAAGYSLWFPGLFFLGGLGMILGAWKKSSAS